ncbi:matrixin family metalloprotease [Sorangium sp. So ce131]|uniref:matrixin family metalloprotease n=1 Tax=Sorangium sp. So ce131 TaxID=3133282 RepID=UPI003F5F90F1
MSINAGRSLCAALALAVLAGAPEASAYCRSTTCTQNGPCLEGDQPIGDCKPLRWPGDCIGFAVQEDASDEVTYKQISDALDTAFRTWTEAPCGAGTPGIRVQNLGPASCDKVEMNVRDKKTRIVDGLVPGNVNVITFRDMGWLALGGRHEADQLALTTVHFDPKTGDIWGADMEINTDLYDYSTEETVPAPKNDLHSVVTHEVGHFLGLDHTPVSPEATMFATYDWNDPMAFRTLHADDIAGICQIYPPRDLSTSACNPLPRYGFAPDCAADQRVRCSAAPLAGGGPGWGGRTGWGAPLAAVAALGAAAARRARRRGGSGR